MTALATPISRIAPETLRAAWRVFWYGGRMSYGMLFNWARPSIYIPTLIGGPPPAALLRGPRLDATGRSRLLRAATRARGRSPGVFG